MRVGTFEETVIELGIASHSNTSLPTTARCKGREEKMNERTTKSSHIKRMSSILYQLRSLERIKKEAQNDSIQ